MSQFRNKNIHTGVIDTWVFRINDQGLIEGDDVVAEDPNELAQAISDTQELILKTSITAAGDLIDPNSGVLERIKIIEDTVGSTSLQMAYNEGNIIAVTPGLDLMLGASGDFILDGSKNITINSNTFKVQNGLTSMMIAANGISSYEGDLVIGTTFADKNITVSSNGQLVFRDKNLSASITLSDENTSPTLVTVSQSLVGAINEIAGGFGSTSLQDVYDQSVAPNIQTNNNSGTMRILEYLDSVPALTVDGTISCLRTLESAKIEIKNGLATPMTIYQTGEIESERHIKSELKIITPKVESESGELTLTDGLGTITLTENGETILQTNKDSLFGAINELQTISSQNSSNIAGLDVEHNLATGKHRSVSIQASSGHNSDAYFNIADDTSVTKIEMDGEGNITAEELFLNMYNVSNELAANKIHRLDDGMSHSAVDAHVNIITNPHGTVNTVKILGGAEIRNDLVFVGGTGVSLSQSGQEITIESSSGTTLQSVYDNQTSGDLKIDTATNKDFIVKNSLDETIIRAKETEFQIHKKAAFVSALGEISAVGNLSVHAVADIDVQSVSGSVNISAPTNGRTVTIESVPFTDGTTQVIHEGLAGEVVGSINDLAADHFTSGTNATGSLRLKGTAVVLRENGTFWLPYSDIKEGNAVLNFPMAANSYWHAFGILAEDIASGAPGLIKMSGTIEANVGQMDALTSWKKNDTLYIARSGKANVTVGALNAGDKIILEGKDYEAKSGTAVADTGEFNISGSTSVDIDSTRNNLITALNSEVYMASGTPFHIQAFIGGKTAAGRIDASANCSAGDTITVSPQNGIPGSSITLTAIAFGLNPSALEFALGNSKEETVINISEAINRTTLTDGAGGNGHGCVSRPYASFVALEWRGPGRSGNEVSISTSSGVLATTSLSGGTAEVEIYTSDRSADSRVTSSNQPSRLYISPFTDDEGDSQYLTTERWFSPDREQDKEDRRLKVGKVISYLSPNLTFNISIEEPRRSNQLKGQPYDTEY